MPAVRSALAARGGLELKQELDQSGRIAIEVDGETAHLLPEEVEVRLEERPGVAVHGDSELLVALDVELDDELIAEGLAREVVHRVQNRRRAADLDYADRIAVRYRAAEDVEAAIDAHRDWICGETLAVTLQAVNGDGRKAWKKRRSKDGPSPWRSKYSPTEQERHGRDLQGVRRARLYPGS